MEEVVFPIRSEALGNERNVWVTRVGESHTPGSLVLFLDGEYYRDGIGAPQVLQDLISRHQIRDSWVAYVSHHSDAARSRESQCHPPFIVFLAHEVLPELVRRFPSMAAVTHRVLVGASYTGLTGAFIALEKPGLFQRVICQSGSFWWNEGWLIAEYARRQAKLETGFYLDVGKKESKKREEVAPGVFQNMSQIEGVERLRDTLIASGHEVHFVLYDGGHDFREWKKTLPVALAWALQR